MKDNFTYEKLTPMLKHYVDVKQNFKDALLLYRVGDFYETFFDDAIITSKALALTLTGKECGHEKKAPMCGVPHHVIDNYVSKLVKKGYKVALCDQIEDPKQAKGLVKRAITRVITPGTITDMESLDNRENNYLLSIFQNKFGLSLSYCDISTGALFTIELKGSDDFIAKQSIDQIEKINPSEIIINENYSLKDLSKYLNQNTNIFKNYIEDDLKYEQRSETIVNYLGEENIKKIENKRLSIVSLANLLNYIYKFYDDKLRHINNIEVLEISNYLELEANTRTNLELHRNLNNNSKDDTVLKILDRADTVMGSRIINEWLERPLVDIERINRRLDIVEYFYNSPIDSQNISNYLNDIYDLERLVAKISYKRANARDLISLKNSLKNIPKLKKYLEKSEDENIANLGLNIPNVENLYEILRNSIVDDPPISITEGGIIKESFSEDLDILKNESEGAVNKLTQYESEQRDKTGIKNYKIVFNKNNGYSIEITKSNLDKVPDNYIRKQTLKNQERYTTETLENLSNLILGGKDKVNDLEYQIFNQIRDEILDQTLMLQSLAKMIANIDGLNTLARVAVLNNYVRPRLTNKNEITIRDGRHPVIENNLKENEFIANDTKIGQADNLIQIITGPNMAGKSTYMRQMAIIIILAQMGSFVPASFAEIGVCDKVFTRIGASDNISKGESTFMLEMNEVSNILKNATSHSFVILDEVGRGTSSDDGLSIAMSLVEYISKKTRFKTVFATHFHELTILENELDNVKNLKIEILNEDNNLVFLRKIKEGKSDRSYGIEVAKLSGLPDELIKNAQKFMKKIDEDKIINLDKSNNIKNTMSEISDDKINEIKDISSNVNINELTPIEAINKLNDLVERINQL
ncbi:DNA mismatch repair protein MutS [Anaerococcus sp.]|uniref:DNA mismatch repair protein MutS n=1 Tax=Anaerococcus sp. TaxID=1872515 RepID=UPI00257D1782|nr:DNA mismatch repair protein MutS [Anaerococcus sp.]MBS6105691.1 DNA mismatch repair protein MutS [Anaerococcus sp.]MDU3176338.1 DNA mismatch repair protein MutS [Anaerococcus sp.]